MSSATLVNGVPFAIGPSDYLTLGAIALVSYYLVPFLHFRIKQWWCLRDLPGPGDEADWLLGNEYQMLESEIGDITGRWFSKYGSAIKLKSSLGYAPILRVADAAAINHIFTKAPYNFVKPELVRQLSLMFTSRNGILLKEGNEHKARRKLLNPSFGPEVVKDLAPVIFENVEVLKDQWNASLGEKEEAILNMHHWMIRLTLDIICQAVFGYNPQATAGKSTRITDAVDAESQKNKMAYLLINAFTRVVPWLLRLPIPAIRELTRLRVALQEEAHSILEETRRKMESGEFEAASKGGKDFMSQLLKLDNTLSNDDIVDEVALAVFAGHETSAGALALAFNRLAQNPEVQDRLRSELQAHGRPPTYEDVATATTLPYLDVFVKETLRLETPFAMNHRMAAKDEVIPLSKPVKGRSGKMITHIKVPKGQEIDIDNETANKINGVWEDADVFRPERWLDGQKNNAIQGWSGLQTFSSGVRVCLGQRFALHEVKIVVSHLVLNYSFHPRDADIKLHRVEMPTLSTLVVGEEAKGTQLPLLVKRLRA